MAELAGTKSKKGPGQTLGAAWTPQCEASFEALKSKLVSSPVLISADFLQPFILEIDTSYIGLGAVLSQETDNGVRPVAYASRGLWPNDRNMSNYSSMKLEFLALKWAMTEKFREHKCFGERRQFSKPVMAILRQWDHLVEKDRVLLCWVFHSDGGEESLQLILPASSSRRP